jgi:DNA-binding NarL/FixJ family response regulator
MAKIRIVLADDHVILRQGTRQLLEHEPDIEVVGEASDGAEAVELVSKLTPDIVIIDVAMPGMNGIEATKKIKEILPGTKILV